MTTNDSISFSAIRELLAADSLHLNDQIPIQDDSSIVASDSTWQLIDNTLIDTIPEEQVPVVEKVWPISQRDFFIEKKRPETPSSLVLLICVLLIALLALLHYYYPKKINKTIKAGFKSVYANNQFLKQTNQSSRSSFLLDFISIGSICMFIHNLIPDTFFAQNLIVRLTLIVVVYLTLHYAKCYFCLLLGVITQQKEATREYVFNIQIYNRILGVTLLPIVTALSFPHLENTSQLIFLGLCLSLAGVIALLIRSRQILSGVNVSVFYLILYLCTLEILPLLYIYKFIILFR
ncbi:MAG: DUF4271 domain-containing protein [Mangrovibacterium sp.]